MICEMAFFKAVFCHSCEKAASKYVDEIDRTLTQQLLVQSWTGLQKFIKIHRLLFNFVHEDTHTDTQTDRQTHR